MSSFERATAIRCNVSEDAVMMYVAPWKGDAVCCVHCTDFPEELGVKPNETLVYEPS
jgi:hypothetical protein